MLLLHAWQGHAIGSVAFTAYSLSVHVRGKMRDIYMYYGVEYCSIASRLEGDFVLGWWIDGSMLGGWICFSRSCARFVHVSEVCFAVATENVTGEKVRRINESAEAEREGISQGGGWAGYEW